MKTLKVKIKGVTPLIMHSCRTVNPLHPLTKEMKKYTGKRKKVDDDHVKISQLDWLAAAYYNEDVNRPVDDWLTPDMYLYVPAENMEKTILNGGKNFKKGTDIQKYCHIPAVELMLILEEKKTVKEYWQDLRYHDTRQMVVGRSRITRTRARFNQWQLEFDYCYDDTKIDLDSIVNSINFAGQYVGLCDSRPKYGQFSAVIEEVD